MNDFLDELDQELSGTIPNSDDNKIKEDNTNLKKEENKKDEDKRE